MFSNLINLIQSYSISSGKKANFAESFNDILIGCSFDPFHQVFYEKHINPIDALKYIHKEFNITNIRLGIRWEKVAINFLEYKPYFDYCFTNNIDIILNVGPIKTMRWPEEHIPDKYKHLVKTKDIITPEHPIAEYALKYLSNLMNYLKAEYKDNLNKIIAVQGDNELFNRFGQFKVQISNEFESKVINIILKTFPNKPIFINSAGLNDLKKIFDLISYVGISSKKPIIGINYYYKVAIQHRIPIINKLDNLVIKNLLAFSADKLKAIAATRGYTIEVSELQGEPWWPNALTPGNKFSEFVFTLLRSKYLKPKDQKIMIVRYWGIEDLVSKFITGTVENEHTAIKDLIKQINSSMI